VLDPTCGSGAFLFAALNILEPLYEACLTRMEAFLEDLERQPIGAGPSVDGCLPMEGRPQGSPLRTSPQKYSDFRKILERAAKHPNLRYFVLKSIIINNLYGVDIMEEAIEICKLRLFLKLVAQVEPTDPIEALPDIDFNIRAGNTLVGYATYEDVKHAVSSKLDFENTIERIEEKAGDLSRLFGHFRRQQTEINGGEVTAADKAELSKRLKSLGDELNNYLAGQFGVKRGDKAGYQDWLASHKPFHWFIEFYGSMSGGGFDVIIGNPPYVELSDINGEYSIKGLQLVRTGNLYSVCAERFVSLSSQNGRVGIIVPISAVSTPRMAPLMALLTQTFSPLHAGNFAVRPGKLFVGTDMNLTILLGRKRPEPGTIEVYSSQYIRWFGEFRPFLFATLSYAETSFERTMSSMPKVGSGTVASLLRKIAHHERLALCRSSGAGEGRIFYHSGGRYFRKCVNERLSNEYKELTVKKVWEKPLICVLSSSLYYWFWIAVSDCYHVTSRDIDTFPVPPSIGEDRCFIGLADALLENLWNNAAVRVRNRADGTTQGEVNFHVGKSKRVIDQIDMRLGEHYQLTDEEIDFLINYDIKYRTADVEE
jgi:hypothetical protein